MSSTQQPPEVRDAIRAVALQVFAALPVPPAQRTFAVAFAGATDDRPELPECSDVTDHGIVEGRMILSGRMLGVEAHDADAAEYFVRAVLRSKGVSWVYTRAYIEAQAETQARPD